MPPTLWQIGLRLDGDPGPDREAGILTRAADGRIAFPYQAIKVAFTLKAA